MIKKYVHLAIIAAYGFDFLEAERSAQDAMSSGSDAPESDILSMYEGVGIIEIKGQLTNKNSYYNSWFGLISYDTIRAATVEALELGANALLFDYDTPGGAVSGMEDLANFIKGVDVPTVTHTSSTMASAGYFLGATSDHVYSSKMSEVGSIGVVMQHMEMTEALKSHGVKVEIFRSGSKKAIGGPYEELSAESKKHLKGQIMTYANQFYEFVSESRGIPLPAMGHIKEGGTFIGSEAVEAGLVDKIMSFDEALLEAMLLAEKRLDNLQSTGNNSDYQRGTHVFGAKLAKGDTAMPKTISKAGLAALMTAGKDTPAASDVEETVVVAPEESVETGVKVEGADVAPDAEDTVVEGEEDNTPDAELVLLQEQFDASQVELAEAAAALTAAEETHAEEITKLAATYGMELAPLVEIIVAQINTMRSALSLTSVDMSDLTTEDIVANYKAISKTFEKSLVIGGVVPNEEGVARTETKLSREENQGLDALNF